MAITRKPKHKKISVSETEIKNIIEKGGSVAKEKNGRTKKNIQLRLDTDLIKQIDEAIKNREISPSRHTWILEAIHEKLKS